MMVHMHSEVAIGDFIFSGVGKIQIKRSVHSLVQTATIQLPSNAVLLSNYSTYHESVVTAKQFKVGAAVTIKIGYDDRLEPEFIGFVSEVLGGRPTTVVCEGLSWLLRQAEVHIVNSRISIEDYLKSIWKAVSPPWKGDVHCSLDGDLSFIAIRGNALAALQSLRHWTDNNVAMMFLDSALFWCGLLQTHTQKQLLPGAQKVVLKAGFNVPEQPMLDKGNILKTMNKVVYTKQLATGARLSEEAGDGIAFTKELAHIGDQRLLYNLAAERQLTLNMAHAGGQIVTFLEPYCKPGDVAQVVVGQEYSSHLIETVTTTYGDNGGRRTLALGPVLKV